MPEHDVLIVGGGLSGLACALELEAGGVRPLILEASDGVGGRVRTDIQEGFRMDRGFQVLLEAYPECRRILDYERLELKAFYPGAMIWTGRRFTRFSDPYRRPGDALATLGSPLGSFSDKLRVPQLRKEVRRGDPQDLLAGPDVTTREDLEAMGFSSRMIQGFFQPFFGGVLLSSDLSDSSRIFRYVFRMFSEGDVSVPARGMGEIPLQLAKRLPGSSIRLHARVDAVTRRGVRLDSGEEIEAQVVVLATEGPEAARLHPGIRTPGSKGATCLYFQAPEPPLEGPLLVLNGSGNGPVNNLAVLSQVSPDYAPPGQHLVAVSCIGLPAGSREEAEAGVRSQLRGWFGNVVEKWRLLGIYLIPHAQPSQPPGVLEPAERPVKLGPGRFVCGDHRETASLQGALHSGRRAAREALAEQGVKAVD